MKTPICLVTGFLGSGKTTFLKRVATANRDRRIVYLVNEFSPQDVDAALLEQDTPDVVSIPGGSIFCKCLVTEFIGQLKRLPERWPDVEGVVIEASGMANPKVIGTMLEETGLDAQYRLAHIISVVDPGSFMKLRHTLPNILAQVESSHTLLLNKCDLHDEALVAEAEAAVREINDGATVHRCSRADVDVPLFSLGETDRAPLQGEYAACRDPNYATLTLEFGSPVAIDAAQRELEKAAEWLYRAKGTMPTPTGAVFVDYTTAGISIHPWNSEPPHRVVMIARGDATELAPFILATNAAVVETP